MSTSVVDVTSTITGTVTAVLRSPGDEVAPGTPVVVAELMKLEQPVVAADGGVLVEVLVAPGDELLDGTVVARVDTAAESDVAAGGAPGGGADGDVVRRRPVVADDATGSGGDDETVADGGRRPDLARLRGRRRLTADEARPAAVGARRAQGGRTARENVADLLDEGSFVEYGALAHAAQRRRRDLDELRRRTPADGIVTGIGRIGPPRSADATAADPTGPARAGTGDGGGSGDAATPGVPGPVAGARSTARPDVAVAAYDYTVLAGTQGLHSHQKLDRILGVAHDLRLPFVLFAEGGGGRPGDTDTMQGAWLGVPSFRLLASLHTVAPTVAVCHGLSFAGNAALAGVCDVVVATRGAVLGMAGPAMVAGGGLGSFGPDELGPVAHHARTGAVDVVVADEQEATAVARDLVRLLRGDRVAVHDRDRATGDDLDRVTRDDLDRVTREREVGDRLRELVPLDRRRAHDATELLMLVADRGSLVELRREAAPGMRTALARVHGRPVGLLANDPAHLAGAIDSEGAESAARLIGLCDARGLPVVALVDTPGFMVGPEADAAGAFRRTGRLYRAGATAGVPLVAVVVRRAFGLGAMAMTGGDLRAPLATFAWPSAELGPMGLEGAVRLGARRELDAIEDEDAREARVAELLAEAHRHADALNVATYAEIDDVIDPADTRARIAAVLAAATGVGPG